MLYLTVPIRLYRDIVYIIVVVLDREWPCATGTVARVLHHHTLQLRFIPEVKGHATCIKSALVLALRYAG